MVDTDPDKYSACVPALSPRVDGRQIRVLIVDDDPNMQRTVAEYLSLRGIEVSTASGSAEMTDHLARSDCDLVLLDLRLGADNGFDILRRLRADSDIPVIIVTGHRPDEVDRVVGLELGADDYLTKPVSLRELVARIQAVLRRADLAVERTASTAGKSRFAGWEVNRRLRQLKNPAGETVQLTKGEYALLIAFLDAPGRPLSREELLQATRIHEDVFDRSIDVQVLRLRRKLETNPVSPEIILTARGVGYIFAATVETSA